MEHRLLTVIINPAMVASWVLGLWLAWEAAGSPRVAPGEARAGAAAVRVARVSRRWVRDFAEDATGGAFYRIVNEVPTVLMIGIVILAVVKPF